MIHIAITLFLTVLLALFSTLPREAKAQWRDLQKKQAAKAPSGPPTIAPKLTIMTHAEDDRCNVLFSVDGKRIFVFPNDDCNHKIASTTGKSKKVMSPGMLRAQATRDNVADGSFIHSKDKQTVPKVKENKVVRGGERTACIMLYDTTSGKQTARWGAGFSYSSAALSPDGKTLVGYSRWMDNVCLDLWDVATGKLRKTIEIGDDNYSFYSFIITPDSKQIIASINPPGSETKPVVRLYNLDDGNPVREFACPAEQAMLGISPNGRYLATNNLIWKMETGELACALQNEDRNAHISFNSHLTFTPNNKQLVVTDSDGIVVVDLVKGSMRMPFQESGSTYYQYALSPDGKLLITYDNDDHRLTLFDFETKRVLARLAPMPDHIYSPCFSPDGKTVAAGCYDGGTRLWDISQFASRTKPK